MPNPKRADMDATHKRVLKDNRVLLVNNIVWTPEFLNQLKHSHILTQAMLEDLQKCASREEKNRTLLDLLPIRGAKAFNKFCDILMTSGHLLLADSLRDDEAALHHNRSSSEVELHELFKIIPFLERSIGEQQKKAIEAFIQGKIKEQTAKSMWKSDVGKEKEKAMEWRQKHLDQQWAYEDKLRHKEKNIAELHHLCKKLKTQVENQTLEIKQLMRQEHDIRTKHKKEMLFQIRANDAEGRTINRLQGTVASDSNVLQSICSRLRDRMKSQYKMNDSHDELFYLLKNFDKFLSRVDELEDLCAQLSSEKEYTMGMCGLSNKPLTYDLREHLRNMLISKEEKMQALEDEVTALKGRLSQQSSLNGRDSSPTGYQLQITELKVEIAKKDEIIRNLLSKEKGLVNGDTPKALQTPEPEFRGRSPRSLRKIENPPAPVISSPSDSGDSPRKAAPLNKIHSKYLEPINRSKKVTHITTHQKPEVTASTKPAVVTVGFLPDSEMKDMRKFHHL